MPPALSVAALASRIVFLGNPKYQSEYIFDNSFTFPYAQFWVITIPSYEKKYGALGSGYNQPGSIAASN